MQVYKKLDIITNKHPIDEREGITHHVMDHVDWNEKYFIHRFAEEANEAIEKIYAKGKIPIIIGGTHYYLQKLLFNNKTIEDDNKQPLTSEQLAILDGPVEGIVKELEIHDPVIAKKFHPQDWRKLRRALEIWYTMNERASDIYKEQKLDELEESSLIYNTMIFWVYSEREILRDRLDKRVDQMIETGALKEINELYDYYIKQEPKPDMTNGIWQVIGFKEFLPWLQNKTVENLNFGIDRMKIRTRQYAKYQIKWIKKLLSVELQKESRFNFKYGGKLYLLNASNLHQWDNEVKFRGISIMKDFLHNGAAKVNFPQKPPSVEEDIFPDEISVRNFNSNKRLESQENWKHFTCPVCKDKSGNAVVAVGKDAWDIHEKSRRHKRLIGTKRQKPNAANAASGGAAGLQAVVNTPDKITQ